MMSDIDPGQHQSTRLVNDARLGDNIACHEGQRKGQGVNGYKRRD